MEWSEQQERAIKAVRAWQRDKAGPQVFRLFGYAGSGKTTLACDLAANTRGRVNFAAFTGKAALMMRRKGCADASTIHSMIYKVDEEREAQQPRFTLNLDAGVKDSKLIVIDECSMVDEQLGRDLLSFGVKVLVIGDPAQLPPVKGAGFFTNAEPDFMLTEVHRQARDNPIIQMSMAIREGKRLEFGTYGESRVMSRKDVNSDIVLGADQVIVGLNKTRIAYNRRIRALRGIERETPVVGDRLVCLKNNRDKKLLNGGLWNVAKRGKERGGAIPMLVTSEDAAPDDKGTAISVPEEFFLGDESSLSWERMREHDQFTYGYALTAHKSQGSQWENVVVFDEAFAFRDDARRWRYTAITRASESVTVVI
jgi:exodeoxyribonuclease-5